MKETQIMYILDENGELAEMPKAEAILVEYPIKYKLINAFEVFTQVRGAENYWISNYGRLLSNINRKDKFTFREHKQGNCKHVLYEVSRTIISYPLKFFKNGTKIDKSRKSKFEIRNKVISEEECNRILDELQKKNPKRKYVVETSRYKYEQYTEDLVREHFLKNNRKGGRIWHKDGDEDNNWYKNLIYVNGDEFDKLKNGIINWEDLEPRQEYIEYENKASSSAYTAYSVIRNRCINGGNQIEDIPEAYRDVTMCKEWIDNPKAFIKWYLEHYYCIDGEVMAVDKDLFGKEQKVYSSENCCILPQGLNSLLVSCKKRYFKNGKTNDLPLGVTYDEKKNKYYGRITFSEDDGVTILSEWDTPEEAFDEYKKMKQANYYRKLLNYKDKIPDYIYKEMLKIDIQPY